MEVRDSNIQFDKYGEVFRKKKYVQIFSVSLELSMDASAMVKGARYLVSDLISLASPHSLNHGEGAHPHHPGMQHIGVEPVVRFASTVQL